MNGVIDRCPTGIVGFDKLCDGGFVRNSDNLIVGGPGSGKSTFLLQFLWNGATQFGENGLYCSFEPDIVDTLGDSMAHGWDFTKLSEEGKIRFMRFAPQTSIEELKKELKRMVSKNNVRRICFDPVSVLALNLSDQGKIRQAIFELSNLMKRMKVTTVFADESLEGEGNWMSGDEWSKTDILRFLSDSVSIFYESAIAGAGDRAVRITKMRRTAHERAAFGMTINDKGIEVFGKKGERVQMKVIEKAPHNVHADIIPKVVTRPVVGSKVRVVGVSDVEKAKRAPTSGVVPSVPAVVDRVREPVPVSPAVPSADVKPIPSVESVPVEVVPPKKSTTVFSSSSVVT